MHGAKPVKQVAKTIFGVSGAREGYRLHTILRPLLDAFSPHHPLSPKAVVRPAASRGISKVTYFHSEKLLDPRRGPLTPKMNIRRGDCLTFALFARTLVTEGRLPLVDLGFFPAFPLLNTFFLGAAPVCMLDVCATFVYKRGQYDVWKGILISGKTLFSDGAALLCVA